MNRSNAQTERGRRWYVGDRPHVDVRGLPCPEPLVTVLRLIDGSEVGDGLTALVSQEPLLLYPELDARGWRYRTVTSAGDTLVRNGEVVLEIERSAK
ncbi:DUF2249 domain-containing protein [Rhodopseudomonas palustris]|uniref:DUF2249 domain-containing protein n=1 Tax=Rhodopseudomonas palustris TaxID=1076 RepID=UPI000E5C40C5|nr:DUF2249 domain-containing protein [Rhodopseudomonas palustris]QLH71154.1 DUF2249 domain-containing protein [Rhodopseudomonas palustris]RHZ97378.1 DUF2249 domain-containing protein [Rhodopseudomonas palustris]